MLPEPAGEGAGVGAGTAGVGWGGAQEQGCYQPGRSHAGLGRRLEPGNLLEVVMVSGL